MMRFTEAAQDVRLDQLRAAVLEELDRSEG